MDSEELIGVVTVTYNSADVLPDFLRSMEEQTHQGFLLFTVDNASKDDTVSILRGWGDERLRIRIVVNSDNRGVAEGNNQGICAALEAGCNSILLLNNDTQFEPALIAKLADGLITYSVDMICPKILYFDDPRRIWAAGGAFRRLHGYHSKHFGEDEIDRGQYDYARLIKYVPTCCVLIRKQVFERIGLMDERYFVYWDDTDFMYRAMKAGIRLFYLPEAKLLHKSGSLTGGGNVDTPFAIRYGTRNSLFFLLKHFGIFLSLPWLALNQIVWFLKLALHRKPKPWYAMKQSAFRESLAMWKRRNKPIVMKEVDR